MSGKESASRSSQDWVAEYAKVRERHVRHAARLEELISQLLRSADIEILQIESRAKTAESFGHKIARNPTKYTDPLEQILDFTGVRIVAYYLSDVAKIGALIEAEFQVDLDNSWKQASRLEHDRFGYASDHYIARCSAARAALAEWDDFAELPAEIQVRTVLQHAWASIDHKLEYKRESDIPLELRRQLSRVSALLEVGDEQFEAARSAAERLEANYEERARTGDLTLPIDSESIRAYIHENSLVEQLSEMATEAGFDMLPADNDSFNDLISACSAAGFSSIAELNESLQQSVERGLDKLKSLRKLSKTNSWTIDRPFLLSLLVWLSPSLDFDSIDWGEDVGSWFVDRLVAVRAEFPN